MAANLKRVLGFTLIELMVTLAIIVILLLLALPSFYSMRQRAALRSGGEEALGLWSQARLESAKRNALVKFGVATNGTGYCFGVGTATAEDDDVPCDCFTAGVCDIASFPGTGNQAEWRSVTLSGTPTLGAGTAGHTAVVMDPHTSSLTNSDGADAITLNGPPGKNAYSVTLMIDQFGRGVLCEPSSAASKMSDYSDRHCAL